jgi:hypothetical protein
VPCVIPTHCSTVESLFKGVAELVAKPEPIDPRIQYQITNRKRVRKITSAVEVSYDEARTVDGEEESVNRSLSEIVADTEIGTCAL